MRYKTCSVELKFDVTKEEDISPMPSRDELKDSFSKMLSEWAIVKGFVTISRVSIKIDNQDC